MSASCPNIRSLLSATLPRMSAGLCLQAAETIERGGSVSL